MAQKFFKLHAGVKKCWNVRALVVQPSRIPHRISKILFALGANEFLAMLEGKIREAPFFKVQSGKISVWIPWHKYFESCELSIQTLKISKVVPDKNNLDLVQLPV